MQLDNGLDGNPLFRKVIRPWYDGSLACWILVAAMGGVFFFSWVGIQAARNHPFYGEYIWVPITVLILSILVAGSVMLRLFHRYYAQYLENKDL